MGYQERMKAWLAEQATGILIQDLSYTVPTEMLVVAGDWELRDDVFAFSIVEGGMRTINIERAKFNGDDWELTSALSGGTYRVTYWWRDDHKRALQEWAQTRDASDVRRNINGYFKMRDQREV